MFPFRYANAKTNDDGPFQLSRRVVRNMAPALCGLRAPNSFN